MRKSKIKELEQQISSVEFYVNNPQAFTFWAWKQIFLLFSLLMAAGAFFYIFFPKTKDFVPLFQIHFYLVAYAMGRSISNYSFIKSLENSTAFLKKKRHFLESIQKDLDTESKKLNNP